LDRPRAAHDVGVGDDIALVVVDDPLPMEPGVLIWTIDAGSTSRTRRSNAV
jgi:hypothetical protein